MDLRTWIRTDLEGIQLRFDQSIDRYVPRDRWRDRLAGASSGPPVTSSIAGLLFHSTYHHDLAINTAVLDRDPLLERWRGSLGLDGCPPETGLSEAESEEAVQRLDLDALPAYFAAVTENTVEWTHRVSTYALDTIAPNCRRLERAGVRDEVVPWLHRMWDAKTVGWLVQWPAVGHPQAHLGEMTAVRNALGFSPF